MTGYELLERLANCDLDEQVYVSVDGIDYNAVSLCWEEMDGENFITIYGEKKERNDADILR